MANSTASLIVSVLPHLTPLLLRLDWSNFQFLKAQVMSTIGAHGIDDILLGIESPPTQFVTATTGDSSVTSLNSDYTIWMRRDQLLLNWILASISESMLGYLTRCSTSAEVWSVLSQLFHTQSKARVLHLKFQLQTMKKGDMAIDDYILKMRTIADDLKSVGQFLPDDELAMYILGGLGSDYESVVVNLTSRLDSLSLSEVQFSLQTHEMRLRSQVASIPVALQTSVQQNNSGDFQPNANVTYARGNYNSGNRGRGRFSRGRGRGGKSYKNNDKPVCQLCGKTNHLALKCYKRFDISFIGSDSDSSAAPQAYFGSNEAGPSNASTTDPNWYFDNGATNHVTANLENLSLQASTYQGNDKLTVGQANTSSVAGRST